MIKKNDEKRTIKVRKNFMRLIKNACQRKIIMNLRIINFTSQLKHIFILCTSNVFNTLYLCVGNKLISSNNITLKALCPYTASHAFKIA